MTFTDSLIFLLWYNRMHWRRCKNHTSRRYQTVVMIFLCAASTLECITELFRGTTILQRDTCYRTQSILFCVTECNGGVNCFLAQKKTESTLHIYFFIFQLSLGEFIDIICLFLKYFLNIFYSWSWCRWSRTACATNIVIVVYASPSNNNINLPLSTANERLNLH